MGLRSMNKEFERCETLDVQDLIYTIRGKQLMLDSDLAYLYAVETKVLNQVVKRNSARFPEPFRSQKKRMMT